MILSTELFVAMKNRDGPQILWMTSYRWLKILLGVLGTETQFSDRAVIPFAAEFPQTEP